MHNPSLSFEDVLDDCILAIQEQDKSVADCLVQYPERREALEPLLNLVTRLQAARTLEAPPEFRRVAVTRMRNLIAAHPRKAERRDAKNDLWRRAWRRVKAPAVALAGAGLVALSLLLLALLSADALPGDRLYSLKKRVEQVRLAASLDDAGDAELQIRFAAERLEEATALAGENRPPQVEQALAGYVRQFDGVVDLFDAGSGLSPDERATLARSLAVNLTRNAGQFQEILALLDADSPLSSGEQVALARPLAAHLPPHVTQLTTLMSRVPASARPGVEAALAASGALLERARDLLKDDEVDEVPTQPSLPGDQPLEEMATPTPYPTTRSTRTPTASPSPTASPTATPSPTASPTATPSPTASPTVTPSPTASPTATPSPLPPSPTPTASLVPPTATAPPPPPPTDVPPPPPTATLPPPPPPTATSGPPDWTPSPGPPDVTLPAISSTPPPTRPLSPTP